jgi:hypothetical protein
MSLSTPERKNCRPGQWRRRKQKIRRGQKNVNKMGIEEEEEEVDKK